MNKNCQIKLAKHTIKSDESINLHAGTLTFSWAFDALKMPAKAMENAQHSDFMFSQMHNKIVELDSQTQNATKLEDLLNHQCHRWFFKYCHILLGYFNLHPLHANFGHMMECLSMKTT